MTSSPDKPVPTVASLEAAEFTVQYAQGKALASEVIAEVAKPDALPTALLDVIRREAQNAWAPYRFQGFCAGLQEALAKASDNVGK